MTDRPDRSGLRALQDRTAIVGVGTTEFGAIYRDLDPERSAYELGLIAFREALSDAGLKRTDVDGVIVSRLPHYSRMCEMIGLRHPRFVNVLPGEGRQSGIALQYAALAVANGMADVVACIYGNNGRSAGARYGGEDRGVSTQAMFEAPYGMTSPGAVTSLMFRRYQYRHGATTAALGHLAISNRANAALNPNAVMQRPITMDDYLGARYIAEPLCLFDYCLINDGGVCFIVTSAERARDLKHTPVLIHATSQASDITPVYVADDFWSEPMSQIADDLFAVSDAQREDLASRSSMTISLQRCSSHSKVWASASLARAATGSRLSVSACAVSCRSTPAAGTRPSPTCRAGHCTSRPCDSSDTSAASARSATRSTAYTPAPPHWPRGTS